MKNRQIGMLILLALIPFATFADGFSTNSWGNHMGFMGGGWMMILLAGLLIITIVAITKWATAPKKNLDVTNDARSILAERFVKGEITSEEFLEMKKQLK